MLESIDEIKRLTLAAEAAAKDDGSFYVYDPELDLESWKVMLCSQVHARLSAEEPPLDRIVRAARAASSQSVNFVEKFCQYCAAFIQNQETVAVHADFGYGDGNCA